jgi:hypothetical protein
LFDSSAFALLWASLSFPLVAFCGGKTSLTGTTARKISSFRIGRVQVRLRSQVWYLFRPEFEPIAIPELRERWLQHREQAPRSSVQTIDRSRTAAARLLRFAATIRPVRCASHFGNGHAEEFVPRLRTIQVAANGHQHTAKRPLMDKGSRDIVETCHALFTYAGKRRQLPP